MSWTCGRCGLLQERWSFRCATDGGLRFPVTAADPPLPALPAPRPVELQAGEHELTGQATGDQETIWERSPLRPAGLAVRIALLWLLPVLIWGFLSPPSIAGVILQLVLLAAVPALLAYLIALRVSDRVPGPTALAGMLIAPATRYMLDALPRDNQLPIATLTLERQLTGPVQVRVQRPRGPWPPPPAPSTLRVVGRWIAEPARFEARTIEVVDLDGRPLGPAIRGDQPAGWWVAGAVLLVAGALAGSWLAHLLGT